MKQSKLITAAAFVLIAGSMGMLHAASPSTCVMPSGSQIDALFAQLDQAHRDMFNSLDCETQNLAVKMAEQSKDKNKAIEAAKKQYDAKSGR